MFKKLIILPLTLTAFVVNAAPDETDKPKPPSSTHEHAKSFKEVVHAVNHGKKLHVVIHFDQCETNVQLPMEVTASIHPKSVLVVKGKRVGFSDIHFTTSHPQHLGTRIYQFTKYALNPDDTFTVKAEALNPTSFERLGDEIQINCKLNHGVKIYPSK